MKQLLKQFSIMFSILVVSFGGAIICGIIMMPSSEQMHAQLKAAFNSHNTPYFGSLSKAGVPEDEYWQCLQWAFGGDVKKIQMQSHPDRWNERHSDIFVMYGYDEVTSSLEKVGIAYMNRNYVDENGTVVIGRDETSITSGEFQLDDGTTLSEIFGEQKGIE